MTNLEEAVQEIERLKEELMDARVRGNAFRDVSYKLRAKIERKDIALGKIIMRIQWHRTWTGTDYNQLALHPGAAEKIVSIAEQALTTEEDK